jgi:hypothetical protein
VAKTRYIKWLIQHLQVCAASYSSDLLKLCVPAQIAMMAPYESLEHLATKDIHAVPSLDFFRLRWSLPSDNPHDCIAILEDAKNALSSQEPYSIDHPINQQPATHPPFSSLTISVYMLEEYQSDWIDAHKPHADPDDFEDQNDPMCPKFDSDGYVNRCCGQDRPGPGPRLELVAKEGQFVSVGQYVNTVHAWLRGMDSLLRAVEGVVSCWPLELEYHMIVPVFDFTCLMLESTQTWTPENYQGEWEQTASMARRLYPEVASSGCG